MSDNTIQLTGEFARKERPAAAAITPGHLVEIDSSGEYAIHSTAAGPHSKAFAVEDSLQGNAVGDDYAAADRVQVNVQVTGNEVWAWLDVDEDITIGDFLESAGDGTLQALSGTDRQAVGVALETLDLSVSGAVASRIKIQCV